MATFGTEGIIVKRKNFGEADRILTVITPFKGKISVLAKGVRRITSRRGGNVELLNQVKLHIFQGSGLGVLTEAESLQTFPKIKNDLILSSYGSHVAELADRLSAENQPNPAVYNLLLIVLTLLEKEPRQVFIRAYEVKLLTSLGFWSLDQVGADDNILHILQKLQVQSWEEIAKIELTSREALEVENILRYYIEKVLESSLKSMRIIKEIRDKK